MKIKKILAMALALSMTGAMMTACGDSDSSSDASSEAATTTTTTTAATTTPAEESSVADESSTADEPAGEAYTPVKEFEGYDAVLMFGDSSWLWGNWNGQGYVTKDKGAYGIDADITGDGEYTVALTSDSIVYEDDQYGANPQSGEGEAAFGTVVFCIDITGICDGTTNAKGEALETNKLKDGDDAGINKETKGKYTGQEITCEVTSIKADGEEIEFDNSKFKFGNIEDANNCYRIEIYNEYGDTKLDPGIDYESLEFAESLEVTFTISGLDKE